ncbi:uncharacterized protein TRIADDRAFT_25090 [Trichoplax adhaerens]|uniref:Protein kinase domain-containing protein n=1 Tax=Trichoplax adhaerens TaxID=10228 RepID=B3RWV1_TRIAD|nr:hypothetical protein TRIADDRAFT_25090 [Trichoplax adhaerens]EDV24763.1 hypothetical protein TRIADDRAFT_25090 [Trichoplax adhaerens]|eukprot:XP_002112653.1 hypothetical protein TRIADDRAFT_25090 [Trichoplax adhaerens]
MLTLVSSGVTSQQNLNIAEVKSNEYIEAKSHDKWEYPKSKLTLGDELGHGAYGQVVQGEAIDIQDHVGTTVVAVKMLKSDALDIERRSLLAELDMLKSLDKHQNIISLLGCCTYEAPLLIIVEFACHGDLLKYLRSNRGDGDFGNLTLERLTEIAWQISNGMTYLEQMKAILIHRDLAARNVLLDEDYNCKISDFGLARDVYESNLYTRSSRSRLPVKWMALESIFDDIWTTKSDVWSFGVVVWEIFTLGSFPYPGMTAAETTEKVRNGYRMEKPQNCPNEIYQIISDCWSEDYRNRPSFDKVKLRLEYYRESTDSYLTLEEGESVQA